MTSKSAVDTRAAAGVGVVVASAHEDRNAVRHQSVHCRLRCHRVAPRAQAHGHQPGPLHLASDPIQACKRVSATTAAHTHTVNDGLFGHAPLLASDRSCAMRSMAVSVQATLRVTAALALEGLAIPSDGVQCGDATSTEVLVGHT